MCQVTVIGVTVILLYASRACYNLVVLALTNIKTINSFDYDWYNVSDQVNESSISNILTVFINMFNSIHSQLTDYPVQVVGIWRLRATYTL